MSTVARLRDKLAELGLDNDGIVVNTIHPGLRDKWVVFCYSGSRVRYIANAFKVDDATVLAASRVDAVIVRLRQRLRDGAVLQSMLHPFCRFRLDGRVFIVSRFVEPALKFRMSRLGSSEFQQLLNESSRWILRFQKKTAAPGAAAATEALAARVAAWKAEHAALLPREFEPLCDACFAGLEPLLERLPHAACHGDYCSCNYFFDRSGRFRVLDWELVREDESVACDFFTNIVSYANSLRRVPSALGGYGDLFDATGDRSAYVRSLQEAIRAFEDAYSVGDAESRVLLAHAYLRLLVRLNGDRSITQRVKAVPELLACLRF